MQFCGFFNSLPHDYTDFGPDAPDNVSWDSTLLSALSSCTMGNSYSGCLDRSQG
nr:MAG TPA: hypothetical protein [Caudoviricetes sp.]DAT34688.1 MAG TPA: hypothetical protein [Caudoviricetes sp.]